VWKNVRLPSPEIMARAQAVADVFYPLEMESITISGCPPLNACMGMVKPHVDIDIDANMAVFGWIMRSDGHRLFVDPRTLPDRGLIKRNDNIFDLDAGDVYCIDPTYQHATLARMDAQLIFCATFVDWDTRKDTPPADIAEALTEQLEASLDIHERAMERIKAEERFSYRGIEPITA
jgi:hypothetical protein